MSGSTAADESATLRLHDLGRAGEGRLPRVRPHHVQKGRPGLPQALLHQSRLCQLPAGGQARLCAKRPGRRSPRQTAVSARPKPPADGKAPARKAAAKKAAAKKPAARTAKAAKNATKTTKDQPKTTQDHQEKDGGSMEPCNSHRRGAGRQRVRPGSWPSGVFP